MQKSSEVFLNTERSEVFLNTERSEVLLTLSFYIERSEVFSLIFSHLSEVFRSI